MLKDIKLNDVQQKFYEDLRDHLIFLGAMALLIIII